ncbi:tesmin isoform X2 [Contarinia nasturtii]|uniref:tesmin isoform X2 n=1 Tax=Contarinia nasturtii TaxID=265458 RepID=UPI0012D4275C|nr:tesmin isoform X2 [Contarinia nasturtii]
MCVLIGLYRMLSDWNNGYNSFLIQQLRVVFYRGRMSSMGNGISKEKLPFCKCKRSACVRNYCQCYDQKRQCGPSCQCFNCQNRFSIGSTKEEISSSNPNKYNTLQMEQGTSSRGNRKFFENDAYEKFSQSLFSTARACHQAGNSAEVTQRNLLERFQAGLTQLNDDIDKKLNQKK